jgi:predicted esterase
MTREEAGEHVRIDSRVILMGFQQGAEESRVF